MFFDMNIFLDGSWRIFKGQRPYTDFFIATGPLHYYMIALFHFLFGFGKTSIFLHLFIIHSLVILATFWMLHKKLPFWLAALATILSASCFYWHIAFPWYSQSAHFWGILGAAVLAHHFPLDSNRKAAWISFFAGLMVAFSAMTKQNIGCLYFALFIVLFLTLPRRKLTLPLYLTGLITGLGLVFLFFVRSWPSFYEQVLIGGSAGRIGLLENFLKKPYLIFYNYYWILASFVLLAVFGLKIRTNLFYFFLFFGLYATGILSTFTSGSIYQSDNQIMGLYFGAGLLILNPGHLKSLSGFQKIVFKILVLGFVLTGIFLISLYTKYGIELKGWSKPYLSLFKHTTVDPTGNYPLKSEPLRGWRMEKKQGQALDDLAEYIRTNVPESDSLLVLTDLQILYALTNRQSYKGITLCFVDDGWPTPGNLRNKVSQNILTNPPIWVVTHKGRIAFGTRVLDYLGLKQNFIQNYGQVRQFGNYVLLRQIPSQNQ